MSKEFENRDEIDSWLITQSREIITVFTVRAALRVIPKFAYVIQNNKLDRPYENILLSSFWATSTALSTGLWSNAVELRSAAQTSTDVIVADAVSMLNIVTATSSTHSATLEEANTALNSVAHSARTANFNVRRDADIASATTEATSTAIVAALNRSYFLEYALDRDMVEKGLNANQLAAQKLWNAEDYSKTFQPNNLAADWEKLKSHLISQKTDWKVWIDWYEARLKGSPLIEEIEIGLDPENGQYGRVTLPTDYYEDPAKANAAIKEIIDAYWRLPELLDQDAISDTFGINADGKIDRTTTQTSSSLTDTADQRDWYKSLRDAALGINDIGENALGNAARPVKNVLKALPENMQDAKVVVLWSAANRIRKLKSAHDRAVQSGDDYHPNRLASEVIDDIEHFTEVYNNLVIGDTGLSEKDKLAKGPQDNADIVEANKVGTQAIEAAIKHDLFTDDAQDSLEGTIAEDREIITNLESSNRLPVLEQLALANTQIAKENAIRAIIIRVRESEEYGEIKKGALKTIGATIVLYVASKWPPLLEFVTKLFGLG